MTDRPDSPEGNELYSGQSASSGSIRSRDAIVEDIVRIRGDEHGSSTPEDERQLRRLVQALRNRKDQFGLLFAVCNEVPLRRKLTERIIASLPDQRPFALRLSGNETSLLDTLFAAPGAREPLIVEGIELLLPSADDQRARREQTLHELQLRREQFRELARPLLLWMPEYVYTLIGQQAIDFWSWQSGGFFFTSDQQPTTARPTDVQSKSSTQLSPRHSLKASDLVFVGRERQITALIDVLREGSSVVLHGMVGIGKTELALHVAHNLRDYYPDAQLFIELRGTTDDPRSSAEGLRDAIRAFHPDIQLTDDVEVLTAMYRSLLTGNRALIIVDNAPNAAAVYPFLPPAGSVLLVTSRTALTLPDVTHVSLDQLSPGDARRLLRSMAPQVTEDVADQICSLCVYLPRAIRIAGSLLALTTNLDPATYAMQLRDQRLQLDHLDAEDAAVGLEAALNLGYAYLETNTARIFRQLAVFPTSFDAAAEEIVCNDTGNAYLDDLLRRCLVIYDDVTKRYRLQTPVRLFAAKRQGAEEGKVAARRHATYYLEVTATANDVYLSESGESLKRGLDLFDTEWENIKAGQAWTAAHTGEDDEAARLCSAYPDAGLYLFGLRQRPWERIRWREDALAAARRLNQRDAESRHLLDLAHAYFSSDDYSRALDIFKQALITARDAGNRDSETWALSGLGIAYGSSGNYSLALDLCEQALAVAREIGDRNGEASALYGMGRAYYGMGDYDRALDLYEQALIIVREIGNHSGEAAGLASIGEAYQSMGNYGRALDYYEQALTITREIGDRNGEASALYGIGSAYYGMGDYGRALDYYEQALTIAREIGDRSSEASTLSGIGHIYSTSNEPRRAFDVLEQSLIIARKVGDRRSEASALYGMGGAYNSLGDYGRALDHFEQALSIVRIISDRGSEARVLGDTGSAYYSMGDYGRALDYYEQALTVAREIGDRSSEASTLMRIAEGMNELGNLDQAIAHAEDALRIMKQIDDPEAARSIQEQLALWREQKE